ncbi:photosynthetic complex assembly protein PuhC [Jiella sp. M17.18]|uniref:photosynthetic complex assembly protein PuhC n=1 Tax=Jiella sp. M17.18 TaxID=3234247 RepID=UPI0034DE0DF3
MKALAAAMRSGAFKMYPTPERPIPRWILAGAGALAVTALVSIGFGRVTGIGLADTPQLKSLAHRDIALSEHPDGSVAVIDADSRQALISVPAGGGAFAVEVLRNLQRNRARKGAREGDPFVLALKSDGRLVIEDPDTPQQVDLRAFGENQAMAFANLLNPEREEGQ